VIFFCANLDSRSSGYEPKVLVFYPEIELIYGWEYLLEDEKVRSHAHLSYTFDAMRLRFRYILHMSMSCCEF
jgi:hypothetical protein